MLVTDEQRREVAAKLRAKYMERRELTWYPQACGAYEAQYLRDLEECVPDGDSLFTVLADLIDRETCTFRPDTYHPWFDDDDVEHETDCADEDYCFCQCSNCGDSMLGGPDGWFDESPGEHGGYVLKPRFSYCPHCGAMVVEKEAAE